jgi:hypothetical protein
MSLRSFRIFVLVVMAMSVGPGCGDGASKKERAAKAQDDDDRPAKKRKKKVAAGDDGAESPKGRDEGPSGTDAARPAMTGSDVTRPNIGTYDEPVVTPSQQTYSMAGIRTIDDGCAKAHVVVATAPASVGADYEWKYTRQAMLANQQYRVVSGRPAARGEVSFDVRQAGAPMQNAYVLVATCADGTTCNHLAAMIQSVVKSAHPRPICGEVPPEVGRLVKTVHLLEGGPQANLPARSDTISSCARIAACTIASDTSTREDVGVACQKQPSAYALECAARYPCAEVLACAKR